ncbi:MAG: sugar phosphate isomerase/epimerase [Clostridiales bacterium]|nr:sugar phosphate isomerase/epimerase [Clostridiales bacterium]
MNRFHVSTIDENAARIAREYGLGIEIADFCWAQRIDVDTEKNLAAAREKTRGAESLWFHAPFAEIAPCAIDPKVRELTKERYRQSTALASALGIKRIVVHGGYVPHVYFPSHYVSESVRFWKEFLKEAPGDIVIALENVMEPGPEMLVEIAEGVGDARLGLCLDIGHANASLSETAPIDWIAPMAKHLKHVHLHNNHGENDLHLPIGEGDIDCERMINEVLRLSPDATFTIENMDSTASVKWLEEKGFLNDRR